MTGGATVGGHQVVLEINGSDFSNNSASQGGAIDVQKQVNFSLTNCRLERNFTSEYGGAIMAWTNVILRIREANFTGNGASNQGGALSISTLIDCYIVRCVFNYNTAKGSGGAVDVQAKSSVQVENTSFIYNNATDGGAIRINSHSNLQTNMCSFWNNLGKRSGGAIKLNDNSVAIIESCHFLSNHAATGGAVVINSPKHVSVLSTLLLRNIASDTGGAITISNGADVIINNITCIGNQGPSGGGCLYIEFVTLTLNNSDISENFAYTFATGVASLYSRIRVCANFTNETIFRLLNVNVTIKVTNVTVFLLPGIPLFSTSKENFISLAQPHDISCRLREFSGQRFTFSINICIPRIPRNFLFAIDLN